MEEFESDAGILVKALFLREARILSRNCGRSSWIKGSAAEAAVDVMEGDAL